MNFLRFELVDLILELVFGLFATATLVGTLLVARNVLHRLSFRARSRMPFGVAALLLTGCALWYGHTTFQVFSKAMLEAMKGGSLLLVTKKATTAYALYVGLVFISAPALNLAKIWWDFSRVGAEEAVAGDHRDPVLLLRSFEGDESESESSRQLEQALASAINRSVGPLITLGSPADFSPPTGARRTYVDDADWPTKVSGFIELAGAVIFVVSRWTPPIRWEMEQVRARFKPERTLLFVRMKGSGDLLTAVGVPDLTRASEGSGDAGHALIGYQEDWSPIVLARGVSDVRALAEAAASRLADQGHAGPVA